MRQSALALAVGVLAVNACQRHGPKAAAAWETSPPAGNPERLSPRNLYWPEGGTGPLRDPAAEPGPGKPTGMVVLGRLYIGEPRGVPGATDAVAHKDFECGTGTGPEKCVVVVSVVTIPSGLISQQEYLDISVQGLENGTPTGPKATAVHHGDVGSKDYRLVLKKRGPVRVALSTREGQVGPNNPAGIQTVFTAELADYSP